MKKWGFMTKQDIEDWQNLPSVERVLTSGQFGCFENDVEYKQVSF